MQRYLCLLSLLSILVTIVGFPLTNSKLRATFTKLSVQIAASNQCTSTSQCAIEETGNDPCGGSSGQVVYSTANAKIVHKIKRLAYQTRCIQGNLNLEYREKNESPIVCVGYMQMEAACINGKCVAVPFYQTIPNII